MASKTDFPTRVKLIIQYDGTDFCGWQLQPDCRTVQGEIENALKKIFGFRIPVNGSGRTDAGVHARAQVAHFDCEPKLTCARLKRALNGLTGPDVRIIDLTEVSQDFHARFNATAREYSYRMIREPFPLLNRYAYYSGFKCDDSLIAKAAEQLIGTHSFRAFCRKRPNETEYLCEIFKTQWIKHDQGVTFTIVANRFFHQMVRGLTGSLLDLGRGALTTDDFFRLLNQPLDNALVNFVPSVGLTLEQVYYSV